MRSWPVIASMPTAASRKPSIIAISVFSGVPRPMPTKAAKDRNMTAKNSGGPKRSAKPATTGATKVIITTATKAPTKEEVKAAVSASPALPCCAIGIAIEGGGDVQGSPGMLNRIEVIAPPNSAPQ